MNKEQSANSTLELVFDAAEEREAAISRLFQLDNVLKNVCEKIKKELKFDFAAIQLIRPEENIIEAVAGVEVKWVGRARHYLQKDPDLRDIQADIAQTCRTEIIAGSDRRFDRWIYEEFGHKDLARIFTPILLIRDENGETNNNWFNNCDFSVVDEKVNEDWFKNRDLRDRENGINGQHTIIEVDLSKLNLEKEKTLIEVIGTVEVGYKNLQQRIAPEKAIELIKFVGKQALEISPYRFSSVLEKLAYTTKKVVEADAGSLYFLVKPIQDPYIHEIENGKIEQRFLKSEEHENYIPYIYQVFSGSIGWYFLKKCPPRKKNKLGESALGQQAIDDKKYRFISDSKTLKISNPKAFELGIKAMAAFPLIVEHKQVIVEHKQEIKNGVLYLDFKDESKCTKEQLKKAEVLAERAVDAMKHAINYQNLRDQSNQLMTLQAVAQSLAQIPDKEKLLHHLAWNTLNILAADAVTIYEYIYTDNPEKAFPSPPTIAGKLKDKDKVSIKLDENDVPFLLVEEAKNIYVKQITDSPIFRDSSFAKSDREDIKSVAGILLKIGKDTGEQIVGVMFINYRRPHEFSDEEKQLIEILASSAAIAIMNQGYLKALDDINREIIRTLDQKELLRLIVDYAAKMTGSDLADLRLFDPVNQELKMEVWLPENERDSTINIKLGEGITGWVARNQESAMVNDTSIDKRYASIHALSGSEMCVPLLDDRDRLIGVLNVESKRRGAFKQIHQQMLEALAAQAVIAIQNVREQDKLIARENMTALGHLVRPLIRVMNSQLGAIQVWVERILKKGDESSQAAATEIRDLAEDLSRRSENLRNWIYENPNILNLNQVIFNALAQVPLSPNITLTVKMSTDETLWVVAGHDRLTLVFSNLIQNAKDAMVDRGGTLSIDCSRVEEGGKHWAVVKVSDTGIGIEPKNRSNIFQAGFTTKTTQNQVKIGLWWSRTYVRSLDGMLDFESVVGEKTTFRVMLPIAKKEIKEV